MSFFQACALAELVDNALSATAKNTGSRSIEIRMLFNKTLGKPAIIVLDNGSGMTSKHLNNWAVYRLSKFTRENSTFESEAEGYVHPAHVPRSLNSDISFFGVGGKRAVFHMGNAVRMISRPLGSPDVHELVLSKDEFQKKEQKKQDVYRSKILNRMPGDFSHITNDEQFLRTIIAEETEKESFTVVVITGIFQDHINYLKKNFKEWTRELAHIYHYYIHGVNGNCKADISPTSDDFRRIDIVVTLWASKKKERMNLREVEDDMQTLFINAAKDTFEFRATTPDRGIVEGLLRYHPFLYDKETYPEDPFVYQAPGEDDYNNERESGATGQARGRRDIFQCFWNGRLIPYTAISGFDWCQKKGFKLPEECYSRFSGVLFTDSKFHVSATKLKFMELEKQLKQPGTHFTRICPIQKCPRRGDIQKEFTNWLQNCHKTLDKQVEFIDYKGTVKRPEGQPKKKQQPWAVFSSIKQHGRRYNAGDIVMFQKTPSILCGTVVKFFLHGNHKGDTFATGGDVEIKCEPEGLYEEIIKVLPIAKIDKTATDESIKDHIEDERKKLPHSLKVNWAEGNVLPENAVLPAGTPIGPLEVEILNSDGDSISSKIQMGKHRINLSVSLKVVFNEDEVLSNTAPYIAGKGHCFNKFENFRTLGKYTLTLSTVLNDNITTVYGGRELPKYKHEFTIQEGDAESFSVGELSSSLRVGEPFDIPLQMKDCYNHPTKPPPNIKPALQSTDLELSYETTTCSGVLLTIQGVKAKGKLLNSAMFESYDLKVTLPGLKDDTQTTKISLHPGNPHSLLVKSKTNPVEVENGNPVSFEIEVHDEAGNITRFPGLEVHCQIPGLLLMTKDCSAGKAELVTKPVKEKIVNGEPQILEARFEIPSQKQVAPVTRQLMVMPSKQISRMELFSQGEEELVLKNNEKIKWQAGGVLEKLFYKLYDEAGREVPITAEIASNIKVTWGTDVDQRNLVNGRLPDLQIPTHVDEEHLYQVSYQEKKVSFCFKIVPCPDEPAGLKVTLPQSIVKLGETLSGDIKLELVDQYNNVTKKLTSTCGKSFSAEAEGLENSSCIVAIGVRFPSGSPGSRVICFSYKDYTENVVLEVAAGVPSQLKLVSEPNQNGHDIPTPFLLQLCDDWGNPSPDENINVEIKPSPVTLTLTTEVLTPMETEGKTCIKVNRVEGSKGYYALEFKGSLKGKSIPGPSVNLTLLPDPNKPVRLSVDYEKNGKFCAGGKFPVFSVTVFSEEGKAIKPADLSMLLWEGTPSMRPTIVTELKYRKPVEDEWKDCYEFREEEIPTRVGEYTVEFSLQTNKKEDHLWSQISVNVVANEPVKLEPDCQQQTPVVFYCTEMANRILVENMTLKITDQFGNLAGQNLNGTVSISIKCPEEERSRILPLFDGKTKTISVKLIEGSALINSLAIMENSPGENGSRYILHFKPEVTNAPTSLNLFELPFHFYNDTENQQKKVELMKKKDELTESVKECDKLFDKIRNEKDLLKNNVKDSTKKEVSLRNELNERGIRTEHPLSITDSKRCLEQKTSELETIEKTPRRIFSIHRNFSGPDILEMVGELAFVADDDIARVISWQLQGDMDCIITTTTEAAQKCPEDFCLLVDLLDTENQQKKVELMKKKDELTESVKECDKLFDKIRNEKDLLKNNVKDSTKKEVSLRNELNERGIRTEHPLSITDSKRCLEQKTSELETIEKTPRRIFSIHRNFSGPDILEMVGELAFVADDDIARVISWQLQGDMDCIITTTTEAAQKHYEDTQGNQQVMALDSMFVYQEDRPLPHISNRQELFKPSGNPTFARKHLIYRDKQLSCDRNNLIKVFKNLLGDTILMDDLISATNYRKALVENRIQCPTILTRTGERVSAKGKFGGSQNRAPPIDRLKNVFGAPLPDNYEELKEQIDVLHRYCAAVEEIEKAEKDHNDHSTKWFSEILQKEKEKDAMTKELEKINKQLASVPVRAGKRASGNSEESPGIASKRQRRGSVDEPGSFSEMN
ncbi:structural maintenance of chromosomes flexible hinge domain-containing protein 1-like [Poecilia latipinna]|uniref:structural maintenance of chromosomes flexible hinge domain-containing protein 1-like n=1 Tax=Poecilia latipinna TaxID=48699 RepID=UPI00072E621E|nr:PREDICTED: structural maintenance of chromosomes flexible hinge domain-containing protein 1-like [Poecilia latipinna]